MRAADLAEHVALDIDEPIWAHMFTVAPLVVIGTREENGTYTFAPKHMATPLGWDNYFGFVCAPRHHTYQNIVREKAFTVSAPWPSAVVMTSLAAAPRDEDDVRPTLANLPTVSATLIDGAFLRDSYLWLECRLDRFVDGFGENSLLAGRIVAAHVARSALREFDRDEQEMLHDAPLLAYLAPGRYATIDKSFAFPFPDGMKL